MGEGEVWRKEEDGQIGVEGGMREESEKTRYGRRRRYGRKRREEGRRDGGLLDMAKGGGLRDDLGCAVQILVCQLLDGKKYTVFNQHLSILDEIPFALGTRR